MSMRKIEPLALPGVEPGPVEAGLPEFALCDPRELLVDEKYQRNLSEKSVTLIRRIVAGWSWRAFKPPIVARVAGALHVIDGQHTAIAAASHPGIGDIPVLIAPDGAAGDRAMAFVRHNRDRLQVTPQQMFYALLAAGDEEALTMRQVCDAAGATILRCPPAYARFNVGDLMCIGTLRSLLGRRFAHGARKIVETCARGQLAPISADALKAVEELFFGDAYAGQVEADDLAMAIRELGGAAEKDARKFCAEHDLPLWKGLVVTWFRALKSARKIRRGGSAAAPETPKAVVAPPPAVLAPSERASRPVDPRAVLGVQGAVPSHVGGLAFDAEETIAIEALLARPQVRRKNLLAALFGEAETDEKRVAAVVHRARTKLNRLGLSISESGGVYWIDLGAKQKLRLLIEKAKGVPA